MKVHPISLLVIFSTLLIRSGCEGTLLSTSVESTWEDLTSYVTSLTSASVSSNDDLCFNTTLGIYESCSNPSSSSSSSMTTSSSISSISSSSSFYSSISSSTLVTSSQSSEVNLYTGYYEGADELRGAILITFLRTLVTSTMVGVTYGMARDYLQVTDEDPNNPNNVLTIYDRLSVPSVWDLGVTWNREHVWPQSRLGVEASNGTVNTASDLHNLRASIPSTNSERGNLNFTNSGQGGYYPGIDDRGDVARILFYMATRYSQLSLKIGTPSDSTLSIGNLIALLEWHELDPPDAFERYRNEKIFGYQKNRNPFIDHPEFAYYIWNKTTGSIIN